MKLFRFLLYASILCTFCWLTWWVLPNIAFVYLEEKEKPLPSSGLVMAGYDKSKIIGHRAVAGLDSGWAALWAGWPCVLFGGLFGLGGGYVLGDRARRILAVDSASEDAIKTAEENETSATLKLRYCKSQEKKLEDGFAKLATENKSLDERRREFLKEKSLFENKTKKSETSELDKAKSAIQRLEKKIDRLK